MQIFIQSPKCGRTVYQTLNECDEAPSECEQKWCHSLHFGHNMNFWKQIYKIIFQTIYDNNLIWFQYRIVRRILGTQKHLCKMKISNNEAFRLCGQDCEIINHLFVDCCRVENLWKQMQSWIKTEMHFDLNLGDTEKILGCAFMEHSFWPLNFILIITRYYIFMCAKYNKEIYFSQLQKLIRSKYTEQKLLYQCTNVILLWTVF